MKTARWVHRHTETSERISAFHRTAVLRIASSSLRPGFHFLSRTDFEHPIAPQNYKYSWCVDPLDGTKEFLKRNGQFTVNIALLEGSAPVLGVVQVPATGKVYWAAKGQGAWVRDGPGAEPRRIHAKPFDAEMPGLVVVGSASHHSSETAEFLAQFEDPTLTQLGSSLKLLMVAEGEAHVYPRLAPTCEWDTAASHIIVEEAGGRVLQAGLCDNKGKALEDWKEALAKQEPVRYNKEQSLNPYFVVYGAPKPAA